MDAAGHGGDHVLADGHQRPQDLLSDFAFEYACPECGVMPALTLLRSERTGAPAQGWRLHVCEAFEE